MAQPATDTSPEDTGAHLEEAATPRPACHHCRGTGRKMLTADYLDEALGLFPKEAAQLDGFVAEFYRRLISHDEGKADGDKLVTLFPPDLVTGDALNSHGHGQRDILLKALVGLMEVYDPDRPESPDMQRLVVLLEKWGRDHSAFQRPDGTVRAATRAEYAEVFDTLAGLIRDVFGDKWLPEHDGALTAAYWFAVDVMRGAAAKFHPPGAASPGFGRTARKAAK